MCIAKCFEECLKEEEHKPEECTKEQIRECHGDVLEHPCIKEKEAMKNNVWQRK